MDKEPAGLLGQGNGVTGTCTALEDLEMLHPLSG